MMALNLTELSTQVFQGFMNGGWKIADNMVTNSLFRLMHEHIKTFGNITEHRAFIIRHAIQFATQYARFGSIPAALSSSIGSVAWDLEQEANTKVHVVSAAALFGYVIYQLHYKPEECAQEASSLILNYVGSLMANKASQTLFHTTFAPHLRHYREKQLPLHTQPSAASPAEVEHTKKGKQHLN